MSVHIHTRSCYTLLNSTLRISTIVESAKSLGYTACAYTDTNSMHGAMEFYHACKKAQIKALYGLEFEMQWHDRKVTMLALAKNDQGFENLLKASSLLCSGSDSFLSSSVVLSMMENWIIIFYGEGGVFEEACIHEDENKIHELILTLKEDFSEFEIALSYQETSFWKIRNNLLKRCARQQSIRTVAVNKIYYAKQEEAESYRALRGISLQKTFNDKSLLTVNGRYYLSKEEMKSLYDEDDLVETDRIASLCDVKMNLIKSTLPKFVCPSNLTSDKYLTQLTLAGLRKRFSGKEVPNSYIARLKYELSVILNMHFEDYFLIVWDFIRYARSQGIYVGPGRGSAAGSVVAWCLGITHVDPIHYGLLFERFLNPERISMPDIDTDFPDDRRDEVIDYVLHKYGKDHIAHIVTFGTLAAKQVLRDCGRVLDIPLRKVELLTKAVPNQVKMTLEIAMKNPRFQQVVNSDSQLKNLYQLAQQIEGLPRHISTHAAGIVMSQNPLNSIVPTIEIEMNSLATQYSAEYLEELGLIKMDFLGLRNLTIIDEIVQELKKKDSKFDIMKIPLNDKKTFECLQNVDTVGIFQLESDGMRNLIKKIKPNCFDDVVATIALFRPGPMENIPLYIENRMHPDKITYLHPSLEPILKSTYGVMIYQEQIMQVAQVMAGFSLARADVLRKAMSKKKEEELKALQEEFINGCLKLGHSEKLSQDLYHLILKFANYGFNKSHSVAYGLLAYQLAYLKSNAPLEFFQAILNGVIGSEIKTAEYIDECRRRNVLILGPSVNNSERKYQIEKGSLRFPLRAIKGIGENGTLAIIEERKKGPYLDYYDFVARIMTRKINRKCIESCIDAGALDEFKINRKSMLYALDEALSYADLVRIETEGQTRIDLGLVSRPVLTLLHEDILERSSREKDALGFYLSSHPILTIKRKQNIEVENLSVLKGKSGNIKGFAMIMRAKQHRTKNGDLMAFVSVADESTDFDVVVMPNKYTQYQNILEKGNYILFSGKKDKEDSCLLQTCVKIEVDFH